MLLSDLCCLMGAGDYPGRGKGFRKVIIYDQSGLQAVLLFRNKIIPSRLVNSGVKDFFLQSFKKEKHSCFRVLYNANN